MIGTFKISINMPVGKPDKKFTAAAIPVIPPGETLRGLKKTSTATA